MKQLDEQRTLSTNRSKDLPQPYSQEHQKETGGQSQMQRYANNHPTQRKHNPRNEAQNFVGDQPESGQQLPQFLNHTQQIDHSETPIEGASSQLAYFSQKPAEELAQSSQPPSTCAPTVGLVRSKTTAGGGASTRQRWGTRQKSTLIESNSTVHKQRNED